MAIERSCHKLRDGGETLSKRAASYMKVCPFSQKAQRRTLVIGSPIFVGLPSFVYPYLAFPSALPCFRTILSNQQKNAIYTSEADILVT